MSDHLRSSARTNFPKLQVEPFGTTLVGMDSHIHFRLLLADILILYRKHNDTFCIQNYLDYGGMGHYHIVRK
jgi:hypothetical protein